MRTVFSIIVPCYNLNEWIRDCLESVLAQAYDSWECLVVNDESSDNSAEILFEFARRDARIKIINKPNGGEGSSRNAGLAVAQGEWIFFLDGDDVIAPGALSLLASIIQRYPSENLIRFGFEQFKDGEPFPSVVHTGSYHLPTDISKRIDYCDYFVYVWQFLFRRSLIEGLRFDRYKRGADRTFIVPVLCCRATSFVATDDVFYFYRQRQGSAMTSRPSVQVLKDELSHRVDVIEIIDRSGKQMCYRKTGWLEGYCLWGYLSLVEGRKSIYTASERKVLLRWFYHESKRLIHAKGFSLIGKLVAHLYVIPLGFGWRKFLKYCLK